jgi:hypothetical protein
VQRCDVVGSLAWCGGCTVLDCGGAAVLQRAFHGKPRGKAATERELNVPTVGEEVTVVWRVRARWELQSAQSAGHALDRF